MSSATLEPRRAGGRPQRDVFVRFEGDAYFRRNAGPVAEARHPADEDPPLRVLRDLRLAPRRVLEVGSGDAWRLSHLAESPGLELAAGADPSLDALRSGTARDGRLCLARSTAESLPFRDQSFDLVILGFFLYVADRNDLFRIAAESDRVLAEGGHMLLYDFFAERPSRVRYQHAAACETYKMDYRRMFLWNPAYRCLYHETVGEAPEPGRGDSRLAVSLLRREQHGAYTPAERGR